MRYTRHTSLLALTLLVSLFALFSNARANNIDDDSSVPRVQARVARISLLRGDVQLRRAGSREWESAAVNLPLVEGDELATGREARLEIQIDAYNFVRVDENSSLSIVSLRDEGVALSLAQGTATLRLARFDREHEYFEVDAPKTTLAAELSGLYRIDAGRTRDDNSDIRITVRNGGRARIYSETSGFTLRDGRTARLFSDDSAEGGDWELSKAASTDNWDEWVEQREYDLAQRVRYQDRERYYDSSLWGAEELDAYGDWVDAGSYGYVWRPRVTVINNYYNWAPYRHGHWRWCSPYGWVWVGEEPWGWAPYHYGRWVYYNNNWCWSPYGYGHQRHRSWWHPALVVFVTVNTSYGNQVCWYPVPHHYPDPVYTGPVKVPDKNWPPVKQSDEVAITPTTKGDIRLQDQKLHKTQLADQAYLNAVTSVPVKDFGTTQSDVKPASLSLAQTVIKSEPVAVNNLPVKSPVRTLTNAGAPVKTSDDAPIRTRVREPLNGTMKTTAPTGAAIRQPGVALDDELKRTRLYNGREPLTKQSTVTNSTDEQDTGAVTRPTRQPGKSVRDRSLQQSDENNTPIRPVRSSPPVKQRDETDDTGNQPVQQPVRKYEPPVRTYEPPVKSDPPPRVRQVEPQKEREREQPIRQAQPVRQAPEPQRSEPPPPKQEAPPPPPKQEAPPPSKSSEPIQGGKKNGKD